MKKLLLVLMVVAIAAFLLVGCIPVTPGEGEGEGEGEVEICPTVAVSGQAVVGGKTYIKGGSQTITVTFAVPTAPVSVYVGDALKLTELDLLPGDEVVMHTTDNKVYTGTFTFAGACDEGYIYVDTCDVCAYCKYPYTVDTVAPTAKIEICSDGCTCAGCALSFTSTITEDCTDIVNCGDACSGFASWSIDIYDNFPFDECCDASCETPIASDSGVCPIDFTTSCLTTVIDNLNAVGNPASDSVFAVVTLVDNVGNDVKWGVTISVDDYDTCDNITITPYTAGDAIDDGCLDIPTNIFTKCAHVVLQ
jgi:hypothetical protein